MTLVPLQGLDDKTLENTKTTTARSPFPCDASSYTKHTARVAKASLKVFETSGKESISILVENEGFGGEVLVDLDPSSAPDPQKALESRNKLIKILGAHTDGQLDTEKLEKAKGQLVEISARHKGFTESKGRVFHKVALYFNGEVSALRPVTGPAMPPLPAAASPAPAASTNYDDVPF